MKLNKMPGSQVGPYTLQEKLGSGGNGEVWKAVDSEGSIVALKMVFHQQAQHVRYKRFQYEVEVLRRVGLFPGVVHLIDADLPDVPTLQAPAWFSMPVAKPLKTALGESPSLETVVAAIAQIAQTLATLLAEHGILHRDIKPNNLYLYEENWSVGDFGLADFPDKEELTRTNEKVGPAGYLAPEMMNAKHEGGPPADVYSLAKTLWVLATGETYPLMGEIKRGTTGMAIETFKPHPRAYLLDGLIERATFHNPKRRITMADFASELTSWLSNPVVTHEGRDISHLANRLRVLKGDKWKLDAKNTEENNTKVTNEMLRLMNEFDGCLIPLSKSLTDMDLGNETTILKQQGLNYYWHCGDFSDGKEDCYFYEYEVNLRLRPEPLEPNIYFSFGVCIRHEYEKNDMGWIRYSGDREVLLVAAYMYGTEKDGFFNVKGNNCFWSDRSSCMLGSPSEDVAIKHLSNGLIDNFANALEAFVEYIENRP